MTRLGKKVFALLAALLMCSAIATAQETQREKNRTTLPTVTGGTGLFTIYDSSTLKKGEYSFGYFANNFDRDPGDVDIMQHIATVNYGVTNRFELFASSIFRQQLRAGRPEELRGFFISPNGSLSVFPGVGTASGPRGALYGPGIRPEPGGPGYLNDYPFFGRSNWKVGNTTVGAKYRFTSQDSRLGLGLVGLLSIPSFRPDGAFRGQGNGLIDGSGSGTVDYGVILTATPRFGLASFNFNLGYMHSGDPEINGVKYIDRRDKVIAGLGFDYAVNQYVQLISELNSDVYVGSRTPARFDSPVRPVDFLAGARFIPFGNQRHFLFSVGGAYRYFLTNSNERRPDNLKGDYHGFVGNVTLGYRNYEIPDPCKGNVPPTVTVTSDKMAVKEQSNEVVNLTAAAKDADPKDMNLTYSWTASSGTVSGTGPNVTWSPGSASPGRATITVTVSDTCSHSVSASTDVTIEKLNACPTVTLGVNPQSVRAGSDTPFTFTANGSDPDGDALTYTWTTSRGSIQGSGATVTLPTTGLEPGPITVTVTVADNKCAAGTTATSSVTVEIIAPPPPPPVYTTSCGGSMFRRNISRIDNKCKAVLDDIAVRLKSDPTAVCIIDGHSDQGEKAGTAQARADKAKEYLVREKGIDANRIEVRSFDATRPEASGDPRMNCRIMIHIVPEGAKRPE